MHGHGIGASGQLAPGMASADNEDGSQEPAKARSRSFAGPAISSVAKTDKDLTGSQVPEEASGCKVKCQDRQLASDSRLVALINEGWLSTSNRVRRRTIARQIRWASRVQPINDDLIPVLVDGQTTGLKDAHLCNTVDGRALRTPNMWPEVLSTDTEAFKIAPTSGTLVFEEMDLPRTASPRSGPCKPMTPDTHRRCSAVPDVPQARTRHQEPL